MTMMIVVNIGLAVEQFLTHHRIIEASPRIH